MSIGIPIKLLHEAEGHIITLETIVGEVYRGKLLEAEDNMNCQMINVTVTARDGRVMQVEQIFVRGSMIRFFILPDMLKNAPMFKVKPGGRSAAVKPPMHMGGRGGKVLKWVWLNVSVLFLINAHQSQSCPGLDEGLAVIC